MRCASPATGAGEVGATATKDVTGGGAIGGGDMSVALRCGGGGGCCGGGDVGGACTNESCGTGCKMSSGRPRGEPASSVAGADAVRCAAGSLMATAAEAEEVAEVAVGANTMAGEC